MSETTIFEIKAGDTRPVLRYQLKRDVGSGEAIIDDDLTGATVVFRFRNKATPATLYGPFTGSVESNADKIVRYEFQTGDWAAITAKTEVEWEVEITYSGGNVETFPTRGYRRGIIWADID